MAEPESELGFKNNSFLSKLRQNTFVLQGPQVEVASLKKEENITQARSLNRSGNPSSYTMTLGEEAELEP